MRTFVLHPCIFLALAVPAAGQTLALSMAVTGPTGVSAGSSNSRSLPMGPLIPPASLFVTSGLASARLTLQSLPLAAPLAGIRLENGARSSSNDHAASSCDVIATATMMLPARVTLDIQHSVLAVYGVWPQYSSSVDVGNDGTVEYQHPWVTPSPGARLEVIADLRGTPIRITRSAGATGSSHLGGITTSSETALELVFTAPVQESSYGAACGGELGCQLVAGMPFDRTFVASLPGSAVSAWLAAGDRQTGLVFPGIACPLLAEPDVVLPLLLRPGANGRTMGVLDASLPPLVGQTWFAQAVGFDGATFHGSNGVTIRT